MDWTSENDKVIIGYNLSKTYNQTLALNGVNLTVKNGEFVALMGPSGSGKSTLLYVLAGLTNPDNRNDVLLRVLGQNILKMSETKLANFRAKNIGFVLQFFGLIPSLTVLDNICIAGYFAGMNRSDRKKRARELLNKVGLRNEENKYPHQLSGGQMQRVAIARALISSPKLIFADEPTGNLDTLSGKQVMDLLKSINLEYGTTIVMVTHDMGIANYADKKYYLVDGKIGGEEIVGQIGIS